MFIVETGRDSSNNIRDLPCVWNFESFCLYKLCCACVTANTATNYKEIMYCLYTSDSDCICACTDRDLMHSALQFLLWRHHLCTMTFSCSRENHAVIAPRMCLHFKRSYRTSIFHVAMKWSLRMLVLITVNTEITRSEEWCVVRV